MLDALEHFATLLRHCGERRLIVLFGSEADCIARAACFRTDDDLWLGEGPEQCHPQHQAPILDGLGQEYRCLFLNGFSGLHPDKLGACGGAIRAGGFLVLMMPPPETWASFADPDYQRYVSQPDEATRCHRFFLQRLFRILTSTSHVIWWSATNDMPDLSNHERQLNAMRWHVAPDAAGCLSADQAEAMQAIIDLRNQKTPAPLVIMADRGRGKSAALGLAASMLLSQGVRVILTAPAQQSAATVLKHLSSGLQLPFYSPDALLATPVDADLLFVDEAAAIPADFLKQLQTRYVRVVYATTIHGYEGSGHGFEIRMCQWLKTHWPTMTMLTLNQPLRWAESDPLEPLLSEILLLDADSRAPVLSGEAPICQWVTAADLFADEALLREVVGLLVLAHYQTVPSDIRLMLDNPDVRLATWRSGSQLLGVALMINEGPIVPELAEAIWAGRRRPRGQLLPQTLLAHCGYLEAADFRYLRIMRIAVHPSCQHRGFGSEFLREILEASQQHYDFIGTSFAATPAVSQFWRNAGFVPVRVGLSKDTTTGCHAAVLLRALSTEASQQLQQWSLAFQHELPIWLAAALHELSPALVRTFLQVMPSEALLPQYQRDLVALTEHFRTPDHCLPALQQIMQTHRAALLALPEPEIELLIARCWQSRAWAWICAEYGFNGQKAVVQQMRASIKKLLRPVASSKQ